MRVEPCLFSSRRGDEALRFYQRPRAWASPHHAPQGGAGDTSQRPLVKDPLSGRP
jgi:hypothetical protein